jgi:hypothetical protein
VTVVVADHLFRISSTSSEVLRSIRPLLVAYEYPSDALLGFHIAQSDGLWTLVTGGARVLARAREAEPIVASLLGHLDAMIAPESPPGTIRLAMLGLIDDESGAYLIGPNPSAAGALIEKRLRRSGLAMIDSLFVDVNSSGAVAPVTSGKLSVSFGLSVGPGHTLGPRQLETIRGVMVPVSTIGEENPSGAIAAHAVAVSSRSGSIVQRLAVAAACASGDGHRWLDPHHAALSRSALRSQ